MKRIYVILAKSASGKDTIYHKLIANEKLGLKPIILYYTRPMRSGEIDGKEFRFCSKKRMKEILQGDNVIYHEVYPVNNDVDGWTIALLDDDQIANDGDYLVVMNPYFYKKLKEWFSGNANVEIIPIYIDVPAYLRVERSMKREENQDEPNYKEICRRFVSDEKMFMDDVITNIPKTNVFKNFDLDTCYGQIVTFINKRKPIILKDIKDLFIWT